MKKSVLWRSVLVLALCIAGTANGMAQDLKSILSGVANAVANKVTGESASLTGTWAYVGPDCKFESDNLLAKAGGEVAAKQVEDKMSGVLEKLGFKEGTTYTFNADSTYTSVVGGKTVNGTYSYNADTKELTMKTRLGLKVNATVSKGLLFKADKLMSLAQTITGAVASKSSNSAVSTASSLLSQYDGLQLGVQLKKQ